MSPRPDGGLSRDSRPEEEEEEETVARNRTPFVALACDVLPAPPAAERAARAGGEASA